MSIECLSAGGLASQIAILGGVVELEALSTTDVITVASVVVAAIGIFVAGRYAKGQIQAAQDQLKQQSLTAHGEFLLSLHEHFREHDPIHLKLRDRPPGYHWWKDHEPSGEEWAEVEAYMGLFERVWVLVKDGSLDIEVVERLYGYRIENIVINDRIRKTKLEDQSRARYWIDFIELWRALDQAHQKRNGSSVCATQPAPRPPYPADQAVGISVTEVVST